MARREAEDKRRHDGGGRGLLSFSPNEIHSPSSPCDSLEVLLQRVKEQKRRFVLFSKEAEKRKEASELECSALREENERLRKSGELASRELSALKHAFEGALGEMIVASKGLYQVYMMRDKKITRRKSSRSGRPRS